MAQPDHTQRHIKRRLPNVMSSWLGASQDCRYPAGAARDAAVAGRRRKEGKEQVTHENMPLGSVIRVTGENDHILLETVSEPTLQQMLVAFDPKKHSGEGLDAGPVGEEAFAHGNA